MRINWESDSARSTADLIQLLVKLGVWKVGVHSPIYENEVSEYNVRMSERMIAKYIERMKL